MMIFLSLAYQESLPDQRCLLLSVFGHRLCLSYLCQWGFHSVLISLRAAQGVFSTPLYLLSWLLLHGCISHMHISFLPSSVNRDLSRVLPGYLFTWFFLLNFWLPYNFVQFWNYHLFIIAIHQDHHCFRQDFRNRVLCSLFQIVRPLRYQCEAICSYVIPFLLARNSTPLTITGSRNVFFLEWHLCFMNRHWGGCKSPGLLTCSFLLGTSTSKWAGAKGMNFLIFSGCYSQGMFLTYGWGRGRRETQSYWLCFPGIDFLQCGAESRGESRGMRNVSSLILLWWNHSQAWELVEEGALDFLTAQSFCNTGLRLMVMEWIVF